jgi:hypothetical protein
MWSLAEGKFLTGILGMSLTLHVSVQMENNNNINNNNNIIIIIIV